jgi:hypothetical protein
MFPSNLDPSKQRGRSRSERAAAEAGEELVENAQGPCAARESHLQGEAGPRRTHEGALRQRALQESADDVSSELLLFTYHYIIIKNIILIRCFVGWELGCEH